MPHVDNTQQPPAILSLCSGMLGIERGLERALGPIRTVAYVEIEAFVCYNLVKQMQKGLLAPAPVWANLKTFHTVADKFCGKVDILTAGYPCQPFSLAGQRKGTDDPRHLFPHICRIIEAVKPVWCFFENVDDHLSLGYDEVYRSLHTLGYATEAGIFSARETGAPHERKRLFILARRMADSNSKSMEGKQAFNRWEECFYEGRNIWNTIRPGSKTMANPIRKGYGKEQHKTESKQFAKNEFEKGTKWPAAPGQQQHHWEHPRTTKPGMGCTVNGYNFREDILRLLGNGVVEQTAELAFVTLMQKFQ